MGLTRREKQIMSLIVSGMNNAQIAVCMKISERTIHAHLYNIYNKLGVKNRAEALVAFIKETGEIPEELLITVA